MYEVVHQRKDLGDGAQPVDGQFRTQGPQLFVQLDVEFFGRGENEDFELGVFVDVAVNGFEVLGGSGEGGFVDE